MVNCDPNELMAAARCFRCIPKGLQRAVQLYLLCQIVKKKSSPSVLFEWFPHASLAQWIDDTGPHTTDWNTFAATAHNDLVTDIDFEGPATVDITSVINQDTLPALINFSIGGNTLLGVLDMSNCVTLVNLSAFNCSLAGAFGIVLTNCVSLQFLDSTTNLLTKLDLTTCVAMDTVTTAANLLTGNTGLVLNDCVVLSSINASSNPLLTKAVCNFSPNFMATATFDNCDLTGNAGLLSSSNNVFASISCDTNPNLTALDVSAWTQASVVFCPNCGLTDLRIGTSVQWLTVDAHNNSLPTNPVGPVEGVDQILARLRANCLGKGGACDLTLGANGAPTLPCGNPASDCFALNNTPIVWTVTTN